VLRRRVTVPCLADALRAALVAALFGARPLALALVCADRVRVVVRRRLAVLRAPDALRRDLAAWFWLVAILDGPPRRGIVP
jgi:hypothetical protein